MLLPILLYAVLFAFLIFARHIEKLKKRHVPAKALNRLGFVAAAVVLLAWRAGTFFSPYVVFTLAALALCMLGDILPAVTPGKVGRDSLIRLFLHEAYSHTQVPQFTRLLRGYVSAGQLGALSLETRRPIQYAR